MVANCAVTAAELPEAYRNAIEQGVSNGAYPIMAVGLIEHGERAQWSFAHESHDPTTRSENGFEIGSINKVFTALLLSKAARTGKLKLDDPIVTWLPENFKLADERIGTITLEELATHRSGLPPIPANLFPRDVDDPYADYDEAALLAWLAHYQRTAWTKQYQYSNLGYGLLGYLLGRAYGCEYSQALTEQILKPLGLEHTGFSDGADLLKGHNSEGQPTAHWHLGALPGAGALRSTLEDMLDFAQLNLKPGDHPLRADLLLARQPRGAIASGEIGLAWHIVDAPSDDQPWPLVWHNGITGGFSSFIGFRVDRQQALVLLSNSVVDLSAIGIALMTDRPAPPPPRKPLVIAPAQLAELTGLYQILPGTEITVRVKHDRLEAQFNGQAALPLYAADTDAFFYRALDADLRFVRSEGKINGLVLHQDSQYFSAKRLSARPPTLKREGLKIPAQDLLEFTGDYQFDADTQVRVVCHEDELQLQLTARSAEPLLAYAKDRFATVTDGSTIAFNRTATGKITGLSLAFAGTERSATRIDWKAQ